ncbi:MAG: hypothetical protein GY714_19865 [Desulfobacterales bacterium]|nr:hypothetical protein [Desulfobacterales bacterium]
MKNLFNNLGVLIAVIVMVFVFLITAIIDGIIKVEEFFIKFKSYIKKFRR